MQKNDLCFVAGQGQPREREAVVEREAARRAISHAEFEIISAEPRLAAEIQAFVRDRLAAYQYPRAIEFVDGLPMTATGKIMRRELRQRSGRRSV